MVDANDPSQAVYQRISRLSPREMDVVQLRAAGKSTRDIAQSLQLAISTIHTLSARIAAKLNCKDSHIITKAWIVFQAERRQK